MEPRYPVLLDLAGRRCVVVGGGAVAGRRIAGLLAVGAHVTVVAPELGPAVAALAAAGRVTWEARTVDAAAAPGVLAGGGSPGDRPWLVVAATDDRAVNAAVVAAAGAVGVWGNDATAGTGGPLAVPAVHRVGPVTVAVATGGVSPSAAAWLRDELVRALPPEVPEALRLLAEVLAEADAADAASDASAGRRPPESDIGHTSASGRRVDWQRVLASGTLDAIREGRADQAKERLQACLSSSSD